MILSITIPDAVATDYIDTIAARFGYQATIDGAPNPQTKAAFAKAVLIRWVKDQYREHKANTAAAASAATASQTADAINVT